MCLDNLSSCNLIGFSSSLALLVGNDLSADELALLSTFFTSFADNLALIATTKSTSENTFDNNCQKIQ